MDKFRKARIATQGIKVGEHFEKSQNVGLLLIGALQPNKCLFVIAKSQVCIHERRSRNITCLLLSFEFLE
jgi:uncharacterized pyridoxal phosphate-containing UPF0001 family protein